MKLSEVIARAVKITLLPSHQWKEVREDNDTFRILMWEYAFPLILFSAIGRTIGFFIVLLPVLGWTWQFLFILLFNLVSWVLIPYLLLVAAGYLLSFTLPRLGVETTLVPTLKLVVYTFTPLFIVTFIVYLHPLLRLLIPLGIYPYIVYTIYLFWTGIRELFRIPLEKKIRFILVTVTVMIGSAFLAQHLYGWAFDFLFPGMAVYVK